MNEPPLEAPFNETVDETFDEETMLRDESPLVEETSSEYLGRWNRLISTTNWEKGRIILQWRDALSEAGASPTSYSDEAWSRRVGHVTPQHVGRLRRVFHRFGSDYEQYAGLYWSHFQAALDWDDAEMYLQGAVENGWSVAQMRNQRWEAMGAPPAKKPHQEDIFTAELDEDVDPDLQGPTADSISDSSGVVRNAEAGGDREPPPARHAADEDADWADEPGAEPIRPFEDIGTLPPDLNEAFELFKLAIVNHKASGWRETSLDDVLAVLNGLRQLALAPSGD
ncbi:MAG: hypothetical protein JXB62_10785 [Pirellulales bacterium]|nr:hypothetical protein [Pirellulales bacterium]